MTPTELENNINCMQEMVHKFECEVVEKQENLIMQTIQQIGGETYSHITIDKNKVLDAFMKQTPKKIDNKGIDDLVCGCHRCGEINALWKMNGDRNNYCGNCGQAIDWGDGDADTT